MKEMDLASYKKGYKDGVASGEINKAAVKNAYRKGAQHFVKRLLDTIDIIHTFPRENLTDTQRVKDWLQNELNKANQNTTQSNIIEVINSRRGFP